MRHPRHIAAGIASGSRFKRRLEVPIRRAAAPPTGISLMVGNTLREHLGVGRVERDLVLPHSFALAGAGVAIHIRRSILREHLIDHELALAGAVVYRRSRTKKPTHGGFWIGAISSGPNPRIRRPFFDIGLQRHLFVAPSSGFPILHLSARRLCVWHTCK